MKILIDKYNMVFEGHPKVGKNQTIYVNQSGLWLSENAKFDNLAKGHYYHTVELDWKVVYNTLYDHLWEKTKDE